MKIREIAYIAGLDVMSYLPFDLHVNAFLHLSEWFAYLLHAYCFWIFLSAYVVNARVLVF